MTRPCLPPRANQSPPPTPRPPAGACDSHAHVFGPYDRFALADDRSYTPPPALVDSFLAHLDRLGIDRGVLVTGSASGTDNTVILDALQRHPDRLRGVVVPAHDTDAATLSAWHAAGVRGVRANLFKRDGHAVYRNGVGLEVLEALAPQLRELGWHAQIWIHAPDLPELAPRLRRLKVPLVVDHMGRMATTRGVNDAGFQCLCQLLADGVAWTKISGADRNGIGQGIDPPYSDVDPFAQALLAANDEHIVWGSDWPHINYYDEAHVPDDRALFGLLARWIPDDARRHRVLVDNPARLYDFARNA